MPSVAEKRDDRLRSSRFEPMVQINEPVCKLNACPVSQRHVLVGWTSAPQSAMSLGVSSNTFKNLAEHNAIALDDKRSMAHFVCMGCQSCVDPTLCNRMPLTGAL